MSPQPIPTRVLVVDDDSMSRDLLALLLEGEGYAVNSADSGESALALLRKSSDPPNLVLADVQLPGLSGAQLAGKLRRACGPATLLLAISGSQPAVSVIARFDGFLLKPFTMQQVADALAAHTRGPSAAPTPKRERRIPSPRRAPPTSSMLASVNASASAAPASSPSAPASKKSMNPPPPSATADDLPILNETIYRQLAGSMPVPQLREMYAMCVNDARSRIAQMRTLAAQHDGARFVREAHSIKGGCGMLGATELHRLAADLEANGLPPASAAGTPQVNSLDELSAACDRLERMLGSRM